MQEEVVEEVDEESDDEHAAEVHGAVGIEFAQHVLREFGPEIAFVADASGRQDVADVGSELSHEPFARRCQGLFAALADGGRQEGAEALLEQVLFIEARRSISIPVSAGFLAGVIFVNTASLPMTTPLSLAPISAPHIQKGRQMRTPLVSFTWGIVM